MGGSLLCTTSPLYLSRQIPIVFFYYLWEKKQKLPINLVKRVKLLHLYFSRWNEETIVKVREGLKPSVYGLQDRRVIPLRYRTLMRHRGIEPRTTELKVRCSTNWASGAKFVRTIFCKLWRVCLGESLPTNFAYDTITLFAYLVRGSVEHHNSVSPYDCPSFLQNIKQLYISTLPYGVKYQRLRGDLNPRSLAWQASALKPAKLRSLFTLTGRHRPF